MSGSVAQLAPDPVVTAGPLLLRFDPRPDGDELARLPAGTVLPRIETAAQGWSLVEYRIGTEAAAGYAATSDVETALGHAADTLSAANDRFWELTVQAIDRGVGYGFGVGKEGLQKQPPRIQCSSWVAYLLEAGMTHANQVAGRDVFDPAMMRSLDTYSDAMVVKLAHLTGRPPVHPRLAAASLTPGMIIGVDTGRHAWEANAPRVYGIDHVVLVLRNPSSGELYVSHSSSTPPHDEEGTLATGAPGVSCIHVVPWLHWARTSSLFGLDALALAR